MTLYSYNIYIYTYVYVLCNVDHPVYRLYCGNDAHKAYVTLYYAVLCNVKNIAVVMLILC